MLARLLVPLAIAVSIPRWAAGGIISEFPRSPVVVQYHPSAAKPFTIEEVDSALAAGADAIELDLRYRSTDGSVICSHLKDGLAARPTLADAIGRILAFQGDASTVRGDGRQFYIVLDLKEDSRLLAVGIVRELSRHADRWSTAAGPDGSPRPITVVISGKHSRLAREFSIQILDSLCVFEGVNYGNRIQDRSARAGTFQWISLKHPESRERVRALQLGTDRSAGARFNVRIFGCRGALEGCFASGADAVNADADQVRRARALADSLAAAGSGGTAVK